MHGSMVKLYFFVVHFGEVGAPRYDINSRLKGAVDRELGGNIYRLFPQFSEILNFDECCAKLFLLVRFLRIRPVQSVVNSPTQLSGRGFPRIFNMKLVLSQHHAFLVLQNGSRAV